MSDVSFSHRIYCIASGASVVAGSLLVTAVAGGALYAAYLLLPFLWQGFVALLSGLSSLGVDSAFLKLLQLLILAVLAGLALYVAAFLWFPLLVTVVSVSVLYFVTGLMTDDPNLRVGAVMLPVILMGLYTVIMGVRQWKDYRQNQKLFGRTMAKAYHESSIDLLGEHKDNLFLIIGALVAIYVLAICSFVLQPQMYDILLAAAMDADKAKDGARSISAFVAFAFHAFIFLVAWTASYHIWKRLDKNVPNDPRLAASALTSLAPVIGMNIAFAMGRVDLLHMAIGLGAGSFVYAFLGGIFTCDENLFEILKRKLASTSNVTAHAKNLETDEADYKPTGKHPKI